MTEPQPELLGCAEQTPASNCTGKAEQHPAEKAPLPSRLPPLKFQIIPAQKNVRFSEPDVHKE
jgi:hypothetical protein